MNKCTDLRRIVDLAMLYDMPAAGRNRRKVGGGAVRGRVWDGLPAFVQTVLVQHTEGRT